MATDSGNIPVIDVGPLFGLPSPARDGVDEAVREAAARIGFMTITGLPSAVPIGPEVRHDLLRLFGMPPDEIRKLWRQKFDPARPNVYRGWFALQQGHPTFKEGIDMGPDVAYGPSVVDPNDPLCEATPLPDEASLPGWRATAATYYRAMEQTAAMLMRSVARGLGLDEHTFDDAFRGGVSTLRLIHYPIRRVEESAADLVVEHLGQQRPVVGRAHVDTGFMTLLAQDGVCGLQACRHDGTWVDVPPAEGTLAVNFGKVLDRWTGGRIRATEHRVLGIGASRHSIPFFYEPRVDAEIAPLPLPEIERFEPFLFGDHLWSTTTKFVEFHGMEHMRPPRRPSISA